MNLNEGSVYTIVLFLLFKISDEGVEDTTVDKNAELVSSFDVDVVAVDNVMSVVDIPHWTLTIPSSPPAIHVC